MTGTGSNAVRQQRNFFIDSWSESGNAEEMANALCSFMPFPRVVVLFFANTEAMRTRPCAEFYCSAEDFQRWAPDEIRLKMASFVPLCSFIQLL